MDRLLALMLFVYYKYTVHLIPKDIRRGIDISVEELTKGDSEVAKAVDRAKKHVEIAKKQRKPLLVDQDGMPLSAEKQSIKTDIQADIDDGCESGCCN